MSFLTLDDIERRMESAHASAAPDTDMIADEQTECGFVLRGDSDFPDGERDGNFRPPLRRQILHLVPMAVRYFFHWVNMVVFKKKVPSIDAVIHRVVGLRDPTCLAVSVCKRHIHTFSVVLNT